MSGWPEQSTIEPELRTHFPAAMGEEDRGERVGGCACRRAGGWVVREVDGGGWVKWGVLLGLVVESYRE